MKSPSMACFLFFPALWLTNSFGGDASLGILPTLFWTIGEQLWFLEPESLRWSLLNPHEFLFITAVQEQQLLTDLHGEGLGIYFLCDGSSWPSSTSGDAVRYICILKSLCLQPKVSSSLFYVFRNQTDPGFLHNRTVYFQHTAGSCWNMKFTRICGSHQFLLILFPLWCSMQFLQHLWFTREFHCLVFLSGTK